MQHRLITAQHSLALFAATVVIALGVEATSLNGAAHLTVSTAVAGTPSPCPVTTANGNILPGEKPWPGQHGNGQVWTELWPDGVVLIPPEHVRPDGSLDMK